MDWNRFEWWGEHLRQLGCHGDIAVFGRQSDVFRREYPGPTFRTPPILTVPNDIGRIELRYASEIRIVIHG